MLKRLFSRSHNHRSKSQAIRIPNSERAEKASSRTQAFIRALSAVAKKINNSEDPDAILEVLGKELEDLGLGSLIIRLNEEKTLATIEYLTTPNTVLHTIQKATGINLLGYEIHEKYWKPLAEEHFYKGEALFIKDTVAFASRVIPSIAQKPFKKALEVSIGHAKDKAIYLPLIEKNKAYGILGVWGYDLKKEDISALTIFSGQVSSVLKSNETIKRERKKAESATRANNFIALLNHVALKLANITDTENILETLSTELAQKGIFFMLAELDEEQTSLVMKHLSIGESGLNILNNMIVDQAIGTTIHKDNIPFWKEMIIEKESKVINDSFQMAMDGIASISKLPLKSIENGIRALFMKAGWNNVSVWHPLITRGKVIGTVNFWGESIHIDDSPALAIFANQIANALETARLYTTEKERAEALSIALAESQRRAITDPLTNLYNRYYLYTLGEHEINRAQRLKQPISTMLLDVDHFKKINDQHGHLVGDQVLVTIAQHFKNITRRIDVIARYGGEEFVILLPEASTEDAHEIAERLRSRINSNSFHAKGKTYPLPTISIGISTLDENCHTLEDLLNKADTALYQAKKSGRNTTVINSIHNHQNISI